MSDELFNRDEFVSYFRDEAEELLQQIDADLLRLEEVANTGESDPEIVNSLFRALHTIKGSGGMLGFTDVQGVAHKLENLCDLLRKDRMPLSESCVDILFSGRDFLTDLVESAVTGSAPPSGLNEYLQRLDQFVAVYEETSHVIEGRHGTETSFVMRQLANQLGVSQALVNKIIHVDLQKSTSKKSKSSCTECKTKANPEDECAEALRAASCR